MRGWDVPRDDRLMQETREAGRENFTHPNVTRCWLRYIAVIDILMSLVRTQELYHHFKDVEFSLDKLHFRNVYHEYASYRCLAYDETMSDDEKCYVQHPPITYAVYESEEIGW
jgi:hypothetical protein